MKNLAKILALILVAFGFVGCDEVSKAVKQIGTSPSTNAKELQKIANSNVAKSNDSNKANAVVNSGDSSVADSSNVAQSNDSGFVVVEVSGDSVCNSYKRDDFSSKSIVDFFKPKQFENLAVRYYNGEIKVDNKETLCVYMDTLGQGYLNINLTPQELEQFDRFLIEKSSSDNYAEYENSEEVQNYLLTALKFFKYYNKLDELYGKEFITIDNDRYSLNNLYRFASWLKGYENDYIIEVRRFLYDKDMGIYPNTSIMTLFPYYSREKLNDLSGDYPALASIAKWAEQKLKEAR